jgi:hypothetical protein
MLTICYQLVTWMHARRSLVRASPDAGTLIGLASAGTSACAAIGAALPNSGADT